MDDMNSSGIESVFALRGFTTVPGVLGEAGCDQALSCIAALAEDAAGSRRLLREHWCRELVARLHRHPAIASLVPSNYVAVQCTYFEKSQARNWLVPIH
ncbi:hypothetical protein QPK31_25600 [Massilia sp. YIM B02769]|uniref:hypothetical protein n=1 Tax=unclassified Massilia TaxID=2609279 RepID=UPI0025B6E747|nr:MULTISPECIES: hypothetical protein [unclassified Massilia]MDN4061604.1 hypothetical protein [Massilia sp. YIM B02769]